MARLSTLSYLVLGVIAEHEMCTPYRIEAELIRTVGRWWPQPHSQVYDETARLARLGLLDVSAEPNGRRRHRYSLTADGRARFEAWLDDPDTSRSELRDPAMAKLLFLDPDNRPDDRRRAHRLAISRADAHRDRVSPGTEDEREPPGSAEIRRLADELDRTAAEFWDALARFTARADEHGAR